MGRQSPQTKCFIVQFIKKCIHRGQLIIRKIIKIGTTRCQILRLKCTKFDFRWGSAPARWGSLQSSPSPLAVFKGAYFQGAGGEGGREEKGRGRKGKGLEGPPISCSHRAPRRVNPALLTPSSLPNVGGQRRRRDLCHVVYS